MNELFNEIDNSLKEYDKSMQKVFKILDENIETLKNLKNDIKKIEELR